MRAVRNARNFAQPLPAAVEQEYCPHCDLRQIPGREDHMPKCPRAVTLIKPQGYQPSPGSLAERMLDFLARNGTTPAGMLSSVHGAEGQHTRQELRRLELRGIVESPEPEMWRLVANNTQGRETDDGIQTR